MDATILSTAEIPTSVRLRLLADTFEHVLGKSDYCDVMLKAADELEKAHTALNAIACWDEGDNFSSMDEPSAARLARITLTEGATAMSELIQMGKEYQTRDGQAVRLLCIDAPEPYSVVGLVEKQGAVGLRWMPNGNFSQDGEKSPLDLIPVPKTIKVDCWLNVYDDGVVMAWRSKHAADDVGRECSKRIACIHIEREVKEREGL